ncbi:MAG: inner membrane protein YhjD, partial [Jatrophihabitans endophyticus]|nr:inner membrane protein YhjD [Jatrophihabitans endophyticus]
MLTELKDAWAGYQAAHPWIRHVLAAYARMNRSNANQYAAAITYFSFLAL